jgi:hypothetical protein
MKSLVLLINFAADEYIYRTYMLRVRRYPISVGLHVPLEVDLDSETETCKGGLTAFSQHCQQSCLAAKQAARGMVASLHEVCQSEHAPDLLAEGILESGLHTSG